MNQFEPNTESSDIFPQIELPYTMGPKDNPGIHPVCLCPNEDVITVKQHAYFAPNHSIGSCPIEKCYRANGLGDLQTKIRVGAATIDGCVRGVTLPPFVVDPVKNTRPQRSYGRYSYYGDTYCADEPLKINRETRRQ